MKVDRVKVGLVGLGLVSSSHIKGYLSHPRADVVAVCDLDEYQATEGGEKVRYSQVLHVVRRDADRHRYQHYRCHDPHLSA